MANFFNKQNIPEKGIFRLPQDKQADIAAGEKAEQEKITPKPTRLKGDISHYQDPEGLTVRKLNVGFWFLKNRKVFYNLFIGCLLVISVVTWVNFLFTFGHYLFWGMKQDKMILYELSRNTSNLDVLMAQAPLPLRIGGTKAIQNENGNYDFVAIVQNVNKDHWSQASFAVSAGDTVIGRGQSLVFPGESKHLVILDKEMPGRSNWRFWMESEGWSRVNKHKFSDWPRFYQEHIDFSVSEQEFSSGVRSPLSEKLLLNTLTFNIANSSAYNYWQTDLNIILKSRGQIVGVNSYILREFMSGQDRPVEMTWIGNLPVIDDILVEPTVDIMDKASFIDFRGEIGDIFR